MISSSVENSDSSGAAFIMRMISAIGFAIACLTFSVAVFIGLIKNRKELI